MEATPEVTEETKPRSFKEVGEIAERAGEKRKEEIKEAVDKTFGGIRDRMDKFMTKMLGMPEAFKGSAQVIETSVVETYVRTSERVVEAFDNFTDRVTEATNNFIEGVNRKREEFTNKAQELGKKTLKLGLTPITNLADKVKEVYWSVPESINKAKAGRVEEEISSLVYDKDKTVEYYEAEIKRLQAERKERLSEIAEAHKACVEKQVEFKEKASIYEEKKNRSTKLKNFVESL